jgi:hypothetical protein
MQLLTRNSNGKLLKQTLSNFHNFSNAKFWEDNYIHSMTLDLTEQQFPLRTTIPTMLPSSVPIHNCWLKYIMTGKEAVSVFNKTT